MTVPRLTLSKILTYLVVEIWECVQASVKLGLCDIFFREALEHRGSSHRPLHRRKENNLSSGLR